MEGCPLWFEVELPETLVRRETVSRLKRLARNDSVEPRLVLLGAPEQHDEQIAAAEWMLRRTGLSLRVLAIAPEEETITGADW